MKMLCVNPVPWIFRFLLTDYGLAGHIDKTRDGDQNDEGTNQGGEIRIDAFQADFGKDRRQGREAGR